MKILSRSEASLRSPPSRGRFACAASDRPLFLPPFPPLSRALVNFALTVKAAFNYYRLRFASSSSFLARAKQMSASIKYLLFIF
ncbi:hypothetical protein MUK42_06902 [Musa troglodytarum]|uniref:Uncharacterized protein n=1 Tax=Musa troglodytarum TaxID=320322 RepID=A0A9E7KXC6_9LILI|nr:hypothetical protein MUK42_06902 [Musa troglodytarum]